MHTSLTKSKQRTIIIQLPVTIMIRIDFRQAQQMPALEIKQFIHIEFNCIHDRTSRELRQYGRTSMIVIQNKSIGRALETNFKYILNMHSCNEIRFSWIQFSIGLDLIDV